MPTTTAGTRPPPPTILPARAEAAAQDPDRARRDRRHRHRAGAGRRRLRAAAGALYARAARPVRPLRHPAGGRRGAVGLWAHRPLVWLRALRHRARHGGHGQGPGLGHAALGPGRQPRADGQVDARLARRHLRRQCRVLRRGRGHHPGAARRAPGGERGPDGRRAHGRAAPAAGRSPRDRRRARAGPDGGDRVHPAQRRPARAVDRARQGGDQGRAGQWADAAHLRQLRQHHPLDSAAGGERGAGERSVGDV